MRSKLLKKSRRASLILIHPRSARRYTCLSGGIKSTGNGTREAGTTAIEEFTEIKTVYFDYSGKTPESTDRY